MGCWGSTWVAAILIAAAACGGSDSTAGRCTTTSECPAGRTCLDDRCVAVDGGDGGDRGDVPDGATCVDLDGDGHGIGCAAGLDCDDTAPAHFED